MEEWFYLRQNETVGPVSSGEIANIIRKDGMAPLFLWADGMSDWTEARQVETFATLYPPSVAELVSPNAAYPEADGVFSPISANIIAKPLNTRKQHSNWIRFWWMVGLGLVLTVLWSVTLAIAVSALSSVENMDSGAAIILGPVLLGPPIFLILFPAAYFIVQKVEWIRAPNSKLRRWLIRSTPVVIYLLLVIPGIVHFPSLPNALEGASLNFPLLAWRIYASALDRWTTRRVVK
jgi:hypothetical protein